MSSPLPLIALLITSTALAHPRHEDGGSPDLRLPSFILPLGRPDICDHTLAPVLEDYYGDSVDPDGLRAWIAERVATRRAQGAGVTWRGKTAYSVQMHIHGSMSEGTGSMETQTWEARNAGVDVLWWSDHDHRITYHHHLSTFGFEDWCEFWPDNEPWTATLQFELSKLKSINRPSTNDAIFQPCNVTYVPADFAAGEAAFSEVHALEGQRSLRLDATADGGGAWREWMWQLYSDGRQSWRRALASDVTLHVAILPTVIGPDARPVIRVELSDHLFEAEPGATLPFEFRQLVITYYLSNTDTEPVLAEHEYRVP
ncbi:MAG: hypothetical protein KDA21_01560, partial [Phycisphaerales bacterium]|nr:hypothetical protein [Phycisphaerales bacterium]